MTSLYIITVNNKEYKIGIWSSSRKKLISRYVTYHPNFTILLYVTNKNPKVATCVEYMLKQMYIDNRVKNNNGNLSEWFNLSPKLLEEIITKIDYIMPSIMDMTSSMNTVVDNNMEDTTDVYPATQPFIEYMNIYKIQDLYMTSKLRVGDYQRKINKERIPDLKESIITAANNPFTSHIPGILVVLRNDVYSIVDGQHRIAAIMSIVGDERKKIGDNFKFMFHVYNCDYKSEVDMFRSINQSQPCPEMYLQKSKLFEYTTALDKWFQQTFPSYVKTSKWPRAPNFNIDHIINELCKKYNNDKSIIGDWFAKGVINDIDTIPKAFSKLNNAVGTLFTADIRGLNNYHKYGTRACKKHNLKSYNKVIAKINNSNKRCYLGTLHLDTITNYLFRECHMT